MAIAPIMESQLPGMQGNVRGKNRNDSAKDAGGSDFLQAFSDAQDSMLSDLKTESKANTDGTGAQGKDSYNQNTAAQNRPVTQKADESSKPVQKQPAAQSTKPEEGSTVAADTDDTEALTEENTEVVAAAQQLFLEIAEMLQISPEELQGVLDEMAVSADALLDPSMINQLVANVSAEGDLSALVTDSSLSELTKEMNALIGEMVGQLEAQNAQADPETVKQVLADALVQVQEEAPVTEEVQIAAEAQQPGMENDQSGTDGDASAKRKVRNEQPEERGAMDALAHLNAQGADPEVDIKDALRAQTEELRYTTNPQEIMDQVLDQIKTQVKEDMTSLDMVLHPASLGHVALNLTSRDGAVTAQLTAQNESVRAALESQIVILKENLEQAGVKIEAVEVTVSSHAFEQNLEQGNDQESDAQMQEREKLRRATHKINLGDSEGEGAMGLEDLGEAEAVNVAMMQADGRRMDYRT